MNKTSKIFVTMLIWILLPILTYMIGGFIAWDFNPGNWDEFGRFLIALLNVIFSILLTVVVWTYDN